MSEIDTPLTPGARELQGCEGTPAILGDGAAWVLHPGGLLNGLDDLRDRIYEGVRLEGAVEGEAVREAAVSLLLANYDLDLGEAAGLVDGSEPGRLVAAVIEALFGPQEKRRHRTYTSWAASALIANGIDPASVPTRLLPEVLDHLVASGRAIPQDKGVDADEKAAKYAKIAEFVDNQPARQAAAREAAANPQPPTIISGPGAGNNGP